MQAEKLANHSVLFRKLAVILMGLATLLTAAAATTVTAGVAAPVSIGLIASGATLLTGSVFSLFASKHARERCDTAREQIQYYYHP